MTRAHTAGRRSDPVSCQKAASNERGRRGRALGVDCDKHYLVLAEPQANVLGAAPACIAGSWSARSELDFRLGERR